MTLTAKTSSAYPGSAVRAQTTRSIPSFDPGYQTGGGLGRRLAIATYDFARDGSPTPHATAGMGLGIFIPSGAFVTMSWTYVITAVTGATNVYLSLENDGDLLVSGTIAANEFDVAGDIVIGTQAALLEQTAKETTAIASANKLVTTATREIVFGCTVAAVTAGKFTTFVEYVIIQ